MSAIGFIGVGNMGSGMVKNLSSAGFEVIAYDTDEAKIAQVKDSGIKIADNVTQIGSKCPVVIVCLPNPTASEEVIFNQLAPNPSIATIIETSTLTPELVSNFSSRLKEEGKSFISAPMVGGKNQAAEGNIEFLIEGDKATCTQHQHLFEAMGKANYVGNVPSATLAKLTFNLCRYANLAVAVEAHRLLARYGANTTAIHDFMSKQSLDNFGQVWAEDMKEMMTNGTPFKPSQVPKKDLALLQDMAQAHNVNSEIITAIRNTYISME